MAVDRTRSFATAPVPNVVRSFRVARADRVRAFTLQSATDRVRGFRTRSADVTRSFGINLVDVAPVGLSFAVDAETGTVTVTWLIGTVVLVGAPTVAVTRLRDSLTAAANATLVAAPARLQAVFATTQDGVYHVRALDSDGALLYDVYLPVSTRGWRCWRQENHHVATAGRNGEGGAVSVAWEQVLARLTAADDCVRVLDPFTADELLASLSTWCTLAGARIDDDCSC